MKYLLAVYRAIRRSFVRFGLHRFLAPLSWMSKDFYYLSEFSKWRRDITAPSFNDFYNKSPDYDNRYKLYEHIFIQEHLDREMNYLEFGVAGGGSFKWWIENNKNPDTAFYGFDTFTGLPEDWSFSYRKGDMSTDGRPPEIEDPRSRFIVGLFQDTLPGFIKTLCNDRRNLIHMDADLYSATLYVLTTIAPYLKNDDIIIFDDFFAPAHEFRAFRDFMSSYYLKYEVIGAVNNYMQVAFKIKK